MATDLYTLELAEEHIAELRGQVDRLNEVLGTFTGGTIQVTDPLVATDPVNGGPETWHTLGTLAGYTVSRGRFRLTPEGELELDVQATAGGANAASVTFSVTMPGAYIPAQVRRFTMETGRAVTAADGWPTLEVGLSGVGSVTVKTVANISSTLEYNGSVPLD